MGALDQLERWIAPLKQQVFSMIAKAVIESVDDSTSQQLVKVAVLNGELVDEVERIQPLGLTSSPPVGAPCIVLAVNGDREQAVVIAVEDPSKRPTGLAEGEVAVYRDDGNKIVFKANGDIEITSEGTVKINGTNLEVDPA